MKPLEVLELMEPVMERSTHVEWHACRIAYQLTMVLPHVPLDQLVVVLLHVLLWINQQWEPLELWEPCLPFILSPNNLGVLSPIIPSSCLPSSFHLVSVHPVSLPLRSSCLLSSFRLGSHHFVSRRCVSHHAFSRHPRIPN